MGDFKELENIERKGWRRFYEQAIDYWQVLRNNTHPRHPSPFYNKLQLIIIGNYPNTKSRRMWHILVLISIDTFIATMVWALPESTDNIVDMGQDLLWVIGGFYMIVKWHFIHINANEVDDVLHEVDKFHQEWKSDRAIKEIRIEQRYFFLVETTLTLCWIVGVTIFITLVMLQPTFTNQKLPFHVVYPFDWHDPEKHPYTHVIIYIWQCVALTYHLFNVLFFDVLSAHVFTQLGLNLKILCMEFQGLSKINRENEPFFRRELYKLVKFHQRIIDLVERTNKAFGGLMILQLIESFLLISCSTFISLVVRHDLSLAFRFIIFMFLSFFHLSYWCFAGDMVTQQSQKVAFAAFNVYKHSPYKPELQRDIMFIIRRAQLPMSMCGSPFPPLNLFTYMAILKQCYSILTVLLESLD